MTYGGGLSLLLLRGREDLFDGKELQTEVGPKEEEEEEEDMRLTDKEEWKGKEETREGDFLSIRDLGTREEEEETGKK